MRRLRPAGPGCWPPRRAGRDYGHPPSLSPCGPHSLLPVTLTVAALARHRAAIPVAVTAAFAAAIGGGVGQRLSALVAGTPVSLQVMRVVRAFPTIGGPSGGVVVDQAALQDALAAAGALPAPVTEWWLRSAGAVTLAGLPRGTSVTNRGAVAGALLASPLGAAPQLAMLAIAAAAVLLAAAGFAVAAATARERAHDMALLALLGATRRQLTRLLCLEQAVIAIPAAAAGLLLGGLLARLVIPAVSVTATGTHPQPPVLIEVPLAVPAAVAVLVAAARSLSPPPAAPPAPAWSRTGVTILVVTHDQQVSEQVRRTIAIRDGRISTEVLRRNATGAEGQEADVAQEYAVLDRAGRLQIPRDFVDTLGMRDRVLLALEPDHVGVWPDAVARETGQEHRTRRRAHGRPERGDGRPAAHGDRPDA